MPPISRRHVLAAGLSTTFGITACAPAGLEASTSPTPTPETAPETSVSKKTTTAPTQ